MCLLRLRIRVLWVNKRDINNILVTFAASSGWLNIIDNVIITQGYVAIVMTEKIVQIQESLDPQLFQLPVLLE